MFQVRLRKNVRTEAAAFKLYDVLQADRKCFVTDITRRLEGIKKSTCSEQSRLTSSRQERKGKIKGELFLFSSQRVTKC